MEIDNEFFLRLSSLSIIARNQILLQKIRQIMHNLKFNYFQ